ncbi:MAG TPA: Rieske (2Fe-2S) protein [Alphaproteobacteria bacterium]|nr:Rieske (2Fe-2S) protein [Alphaproteobacteria bacterium]
MTVLCPLDALADPGGKGFTLAGPEGRREIFVVRRLGHVFAYENACPHIGTPLDFLPDQFLTRDGQYLLCSTHGAMFEIANGMCIHGPCRGKALKAVPVTIRDGQVVLGSK